MCVCVRARARACVCVCCEWSELQRQMYVTEYNCIIIARRSRRTGADDGSKGDNTAMKRSRVASAYVCHKLSCEGGMLQSKLGH